MEGLSFDDILLLPQHCNFSAEETDLTNNIENLKFSLPIFASPMDTVVNEEVAKVCQEEGALAFIHRAQGVEEQVHQVKNSLPFVGAAVGLGKDSIERAQKLIEAGAKIISLDVAHADTKIAFETLKELYKFSVPIISGNVVTSEAAKRLADLGAKTIKVGMGPGSICTTRIVSGVGVPQFTAIQSVYQAVKSYGVKVIADGGIRTTGDMMKAFAAGADFIMCGNYIANTKESPGNRITIDGRLYKEYRGMGSKSAMKERFAHDRYLSTTKNKVSEGIEALVEVKGTLSERLLEVRNAFKISLCYLGCKNLRDLKNEAQFMRISASAMTESHPHGVIPR